MINLYSKIKHRIKKLNNEIFEERNRKYWLSLKNKYKGQRGFVIGNGPSLKMKDLDKLKDEVTIASNKIYLAFESTTWRPTFYTIADPLVWGKLEPIVFKYFKKVHLSGYLPFKKKIFSGIKYWKTRGGIGNKEIEKDINLFSANILDGLYTGATVTFENLQLAVWLGLNPIYIIGCDHNYKGEKENAQNQEVYAHKEEQNNHFVKNYRTKGEIVNPAPLHIMNAAYKEAQKFTLKSNIKIYNSTRGGNLDIFERYDFDKVF